MKHFHLISFIFAIIIGCKTTRDVSPNPPVINDSHLCGAACSKLQHLGCEEGEPVSTGIACNGDWECGDSEDCIDRMCHDSCEHFCTITQQNGVWLDPSCVSHIASCNEINSCPLPYKRKE